MFGTIFTVRAFEWFITISMTLLAVQKLPDVESFGHIQIADSVVQGDAIRKVETPDQWYRSALLSGLRWRKVEKRSVGNGNGNRAEERFLAVLGSVLSSR